MSILCVLSDALISSHSVDAGFDDLYIIILLNDFSQVKRLLDCAESTMQETVQELHLRARIMRKECSVGCFPGGAGNQLSLSLSLLNFCVAFMAFEYVFTV